MRSVSRGAGPRNGNEASGHGSPGLKDEGLRAGQAGLTRGAPVSERSPSFGVEAGGCPPSVPDGPLAARERGRV